MRTFELLTYLCINFPLYPLFYASGKAENAEHAFENCRRRRKGDRRLVLLVSRFLRIYVFCWSASEVHLKFSARRRALTLSRVKRTEESLKGRPTLGRAHATRKFATSLACTGFSFSTLFCLIYACGLIGGAHLSPCRLPSPHTHLYTETSLLCN